MSRDWLAVYTDVVGKPKYRRHPDGQGRAIPYLAAARRHNDTRGDMADP